MTITVELPMETGELVVKALDHARDDTVSGVEFVEESWSARQADALVTMSRDYLSGNSGLSGRPSDDYLVTIHVDQSALACGNGRSSLPLESVKRLCCDGHAVVIGEDADGEPLNIGRKTRTVPTCGYRSKDMLDGAAGDVSELLNNPPAEGLLSGMKTFVSEPPSPTYCMRSNAYRTIAPSR
jgi:hypothetical protein